MRAAGKRSRLALSAGSLPDRVPGLTGGSPGLPHLQNTAGTRRLQLDRAVAKLRRLETIPEAPPDSQQGQGAEAREALILAEA
jgi:hypothetical protein